MLKNFYLFRVKLRGQAIQNETYPALNDGYEIEEQDHIINQSEYDDLQEGRQFFDPESYISSEEVLRFKLPNPVSIVKSYSAGPVAIVLWEHQPGAKHSDGQLKSYYRVNAFEADGGASFAMSSSKLDKAQSWFELKCRNLNRRLRDQQRGMEVGHHTHL